ncbi:uncharacterized protein BT62DRAFT_7810 [Guyanagaster necrorhizus]|uniref:C3H1-type domain-containing protein n=1 Tax=Guyanagaster necrorhizus TaxID=856835 RepID=A0A9P7W4L4_9AGAR|nr:uncharacterized protein BT62DRAFT_7810 [Guyanagaster necrorhizus MCA 3950]KAG7452537.1 hypothetical protein BT62DRAFT_7810 [Guyanagaster necrorhizus MCA 3950]
MQARFYYRVSAVEYASRPSRSSRSSHATSLALGLPRSTTRGSLLPRPFRRPSVSMSVNKSNAYKKYQCRYFSSTGQPLYPPCRQGDNCRFVHPNDPNWPGRPCNIPVMSVKTNSVGQRTSTEAKSAAPRATSHSPAISRFGPPLVSQTDLFRQLKLESDSDDTESLLRRTQFPSKVWNHDSRRNDFDRESLRERTAGRSRERHYPRNRSASPLRSRVKEKLPAGKPQSDLDNSTANPGIGASSSVSVRSAEKFAGQPTTGRVRTGPASQRIVDLFRDLAKFSNDVVQSTAEFERQEKKLKSYTEISATLSKVSNSAAASVAPNLAEILLDHAQTQNHVDEGFAAIGNIWLEIFGVVISEVNEIINASVEEAVDALKTRSMERTMNGRDVHPGPDEDTILVDAMSTPEVPLVSSRGRLTDELDARLQTVKRLKLMEWSPAGSAEPLSRSTISVGDVIHQMKLKLNEQSSSLHHLARENNEVRASPPPLET